VYGPNDCFDPDESHVLSALIRRFHEAKTTGVDQVILWGTGNPRREFIYSDDVAEASLFAVENSEKLENRNYNIGSGVDYSIREMAEMVRDIVGYEGRIVWNTDMPDGAPRKLLDSTDFMALGWEPHIDIANGLKKTYQWYLQQIAVEKK
jgi:GDP-L-fucose synthase